MTNNVSCRYCGFDMDEHESHFDKSIGWVKWCPDWERD